jgi:TldD protein
MVGDDLEIKDGTWTCGKNGQGAPVSMGIPTVKIKKLTVG